LHEQYLPVDFDGVITLQTSRQKINTMAGETSGQGLLFPQTFLFASAAYRCRAVVIG